MMRRFGTILAGMVVAGMFMASPAYAYRAVFAGDIATSGSGDDKTAAQVIALNPAMVLTGGDNCYNSGGANENLCFIPRYHPTWGQFVGKTYPTVGNHDYYPRLSGGGYGGPGGYLEYFGKRAPSDTGNLLNYSHTNGAWLFVHVDSETMSEAAGVNYLAGVLNGSDRICEVVIWHHPHRSSGEHGNDSSTDDWFDLAIGQNVELVLNGHDHNYERFEPSQNTVQVVNGMGGVSTRPFASTNVNTAYRITGNNNRGVLVLELEPTAYTAKFRKVGGGGIGKALDTFSGTCQA